MTHRTNRAGCGNFGEQVLSRRAMLARGGLGVGTLALASLLADDGALLAREHEQWRAVQTRRDARAKRIIFLFMQGAPAHMDTWDPKPALARLDGQPVPESLAKNVPHVGDGAGLKQTIMASPFRFARHGQSGIPMSDLFPETARWVDDLCVIRSMDHRVPVHGPGEYLTLSGSADGTRPSLGAWLIYGLGSDNRDLPGFLVMQSGGGMTPLREGWGPGFLPARYQGTVVSAETGIPYIDLPRGTSAAVRRKELDLLGWLNRRNLDRRGHDSELDARIQTYELAFRMQAVAPEIFDLGRETEETRRLYGLDDERTEAFGAQCLLARRLVERGVRFVQLRNGGWDAHQKLKDNHMRQAAATDRPVAALLCDLKRRGLLDETLVVWGGEFGRTPTNEDGDGRDHSPTGYTMWLAGAGIRGGQIIGATDEIGFSVVDRPITPNDLHATMLHALGIDQHELYYMHNGRKELVTVLGGNIVSEAFA